MPLPEGWTIAKLEDCMEILDAQRVPVNSSERELRIANKPENELYPYYGATGQVGFIDGYLFDEELILLGEDGVPFLEPNKPKAYIADGKFWVNNHAHVLKAHSDLTLNKFIASYLNIFDYNGFVTGTTRLKLNQASMKTIPIPLAPLNEQRRIVAKLEGLLAKVQSAQAHLDKLPGLLKQTRQAILSAAASGKLTEDWREKQGVSFEDWKECLIQDIASVGTGATPLKGNSTYYEGGNIPWITSGALNQPEIFEAEYFITELALKETNVKIFPKGTLVVAMYGEGKTRGLVSELMIEATTNQACAAILMKDEFKEYKPFLKIFLMNNYEELRSLASGGVQPNLNLGMIKNTVINFPGIEEQREIVRRVEALFERLDRIEAAYQTAKAKVDTITQSTLAKAFRGQLVPQDPTDEPASVLLERIKSERAKQTNPLQKSSPRKKKELVEIT